MKLNKPIGGNPSEVCLNIANYLGCECDYFPALDDFEPIFDAFNAAVIDGRKNGYIPVMVVTEEEQFAEMLYYNANVKFGEIDEDALKNYRAELIKNTTDNCEENFFQVRLNEMQEYDDEYNFETELAGEIADGDQRNCCVVPLELGCKHTRELLLAKIPVKNPWEIIAWLPMGAWNECPDPESMLAVAKMWYEKYGAVICAISSDELEFRVETPLTDKDEAYALAKEHYFFCQDRLEQYTDDYNLGKLADCLMKSTVWYFWWD